jgi:hypothetical protein
MGVATLTAPGLDRRRSFTSTGYGRWSAARDREQRGHLRPGAGVKLCQCYSCYVFGVGWAPGAREREAGSPGEACLSLPDKGLLGWGQGGAEE